MLILLIKSMRPKHWVKNLVVFAALLFSTSFFSLTNSLRAALVFLLFCLIAGSVYIINDIVDREEDRQHPQKSKRPIASGDLKVVTAGFSSILLSVGSVATGFYLGWRVGLILFLYLLANLLYSFFLKKIAILDVFTISFGFVLRAIAGAIVINVRISPWLVITTMFLALFLALSKRKAELGDRKEEAANARQSLSAYTASYLDQLIIIVTTTIIVSYSLYSFTSVHSDQMLWTVPFVMYGVFRYMYLTETQGAGGQLSEVLLDDFPLVVDILLWLTAVTGILIYFNHV